MAAYASGAAVRANIGELPGVDICVTGFAVRIDWLKNKFTRCRGFVLVAPDTGNCAVFACKSEFGLIMVETDRAPLLDTVTYLTTLRGYPAIQLAAVGVAMTTGAAQRFEIEAVDFRGGAIRPVALATGDCFVSTAKGIPGQVVVGLCEPGRAESLDHVALPALGSSFSVCEGAVVEVGVTVQASRKQ